MSSTSASETDDNTNAVASEPDELSCRLQQEGSEVTGISSSSNVPRGSDDDFVHSKENGPSLEADFEHPSLLVSKPQLKNRPPSTSHLTFELPAKPGETPIGSIAGEVTPPISLNKHIFGTHNHAKSFGHNVSNHNNAIGLIRARSSSDIRQFRTNSDQPLPTAVRVDQGLRPPHGCRSLSSSASYTRQQQQQQQQQQQHPSPKPYQQRLSSIKSYINSAKKATADFLSPNDSEIPGHVPNLRSPRLSVAKPQQGTRFDIFDDSESIRSIYLNNDIFVSNHPSRAHSRAGSILNMPHSSVNQASDNVATDTTDNNPLNTQQNPESSMGSEIGSSISSVSNKKLPYNAPFTASCSGSLIGPSNLSRTYSFNRAHRTSEASDQMSAYGSIIYENITEENSDVSSNEEDKNDVKNFTTDLGKDIDERRFYDDFTTIDWVRDVINISARHKYIETLPGLRGRIVRIADSCQGWVLIIIVAFCFATIAYLIDKMEEFVFGLKFGVCTTNIFLTKKKCCSGVKTNLIEIEDVCTSFRSWESIILDESNWAGYVVTKTFGPVNRQLVGFMMYTLFAISFALIAGELTLRSKLSTLVSSKINFEDEKYARFNTFKKDNIQSGSIGNTSVLTQSVDNSAQRSETLSSSRIPRTETSSLLPDKASTSKLSQKSSAHSRTIYACSGSGVPEVKTILSGFVIRGFLGTKTIFLKSIGLVFSIASGLAVGKEGPFVHLATCVGNVSCRLFKKYAENDLKRRQVLSAASSAGVALAFGSPIGGVLFALEEVSYYFLPHQLFRIFFCALMSALFLVFYNPYGRGNIVLFEVSYNSNWMMWELVCFILLGVCGGVYGSVFCKFAGIWWPKFFRSFKIIKNHPLFEVMLLALVTSCLGYFNMYTRSAVAEVLLLLARPCTNQLFSNSPANITTVNYSTSHFLTSLLSQSDSLELNESYLESSNALCPQDPTHIPNILKPLLYALVAKILLTAITFGAKIPAGIYVPSMVVGALFGRIFGLVLQYLGHLWTLKLEEISDCSFSKLGFMTLLWSVKDVSYAVSRIVPGVYAMAGAGAFMAGVTRMNLTLAVILFELTGSLHYVMPFSISVLVSNWAAALIEERSLYEILIEKNEFPYMDNRVSLSFDSKLADMVPTLKRGEIVIDIGAGNYVSTKQLVSILSQLHSRGEFDACIAIVRGPILFGMISAPELEFALDKICEQCISAVGNNKGQFESGGLSFPLQAEAMLKFESVMCRLSLQDDLNEDELYKYRNCYYDSSFGLPFGAMNRQNTEEAFEHVHYSLGALQRKGTQDAGAKRQDSSTLNSNNVNLTGLHEHARQRHASFTSLYKTVHKNPPTNTGTYFDSAPFGSTVQNRDVFSSPSSSASTIIRGASLSVHASKAAAQESVDFDFGRPGGGSLSALPQEIISNEPNTVADDDDRGVENEYEEEILPFSGSARNLDGKVEVLVSDLTSYINRAPIVLDVQSPLALVQMFFVKLGVRAIGVLKDGQFVGVLHKKRFKEYCHQISA